jgi:hypothetical protein
VFGNGTYSNDDEVRQRIREIAAQHWLVHRGITNVNSTWYWPTEIERRASAYNALQMEDIQMHCFADHRGAWPG